MDEGTLNDLLECSVCLDRLDTSSKVLPCQHTFCRKCLEEIVQKHKELRCPECRVLVRIKVDELPPNVLLMRILEGIKNAGNQIPRRMHRSSRGSPHSNPGLLQAATFHHQHSASDNRANSNKQHNLHLMPHQPYAKAMYDYASKEAGDLNFKRGDIIILRKRIDSHWYQGECGGKQGVFPLSYVQIITPVPSHIPQCKALYDFRMTVREDEGCLAFGKGDIINVIRRVDENWAEGKLDGRIGIFPIAFVEMNPLARSLIKLSSNAQPGPSRVAPPTPTMEESTPLIPTDHTQVVQHQTTVPQPANAQPPPDSGGSTPSTASSGSFSTPNVSSSNTSSGSSTAPSSPASPSPPARSQPLPPRNAAQKPDQLNKCSTPQRSPQPHSARSSDGISSGNQQDKDKEKRHSFSSLSTTFHGAANVNRHSAEILTNESQATPAAHSTPSERSRRSSNHHTVVVQDIQLPAAYIAIYPYKPQKADELELRKGSIYIVTERCQDGWYKGTSNRTQKCGVFPGNYVAPARPGHSSSKDHQSESKLPVSFTRSGKGVSSSRSPPSNPPELPPRASSPAISSSWHGQQDPSVAPIGRSSSAIMPAHLTLSSTHAKNHPDKSKERKEKGTVSLMRRLTSMKRSKSPPPSFYSMDNPVFEDLSVQLSKLSTAHPVHIRPVDNPAGSSNSSPDVHCHRKSNSLDAGKQQKTGVQTVRERFRCIAPYPPNSEYELELQVNDIIFVHKKRDDGWYKGTQQRTGKTGLFPASFVESY